MPVDFLSDVDITGGNSGSATLNARGEVVGLVFDGRGRPLALPAKDRRATVVRWADALGAYPDGRTKG